MSCTWNFFRQREAGVAVLSAKFGLNKPIMQNFYGCKNYYLCVTWLVF